MGSQLKQSKRIIRNDMGKVHRVPSVVVHLVAVSWGINDVQTEAHTILLNDFLSISHCLPEQSPYKKAQWIFNILCETVWISVVERTGSLGVRRPFESIRWDAKMVLTRVDFPRPVCPVRGS